MNPTNLLKKKCVPCEGGTAPMTEKETRAMLAQTPEWKCDGKKITRVFLFKNFKETMAFVNKVAALAEEEGHHPDMGVHWGSAEIEFWTHAIGGLSENDFIMAAKVNAIFEK